MAKNAEWTLRSRPGPTGLSASLFEMRDCAMPETQEGEVLIATHLISLDPTMRNAVAGEDAAVRRHGSAYWKLMYWNLGEVISWHVVARVMESKCPDFLAGDLVTAWAPLRRFSSVLPSKHRMKKLPSGISPTAMFSSMGFTAETGFLGAKYIGRPREGEIVFVSGAAGATGLLACQTFKALGCKVFGSAGSDEKVKVLEGLGVPSFNYKKESYLDGLRRFCPDGFDVAFDNVGGDCLEAMLEMINDHGRIVLCGAISQYDTLPEKRYGVKNLFQVVAKQVRIEGFLVFGFTDEQNEDCRQTLAKWVQDGVVKDTSTVIEGFENFPQALMGLFAGQNTGKMMVREPIPDSL